MERVQKILSNQGYCSRRKAEELIKQGRVEVNGKKITIGDKASLTDKIKVDGKLLQKERRVYLMFNKPVGCVTALNDSKYKTVFDYIRIKERVFPVGRLDYNTSGLLLLTNDGDFANSIAHPRYEITKTYLVDLSRKLLKQEKVSIESGIFLQDGKTSPSRIKYLDQNIIEITIHEGKNRIIRRIFKKFGINVLRLKRVRIGKLGLGNLPEGKYRPLTDKDREKIFLR